jgi:hypothetical protein
MPPITSANEIMPAFTIDGLPLFFSHFQDYPHLFLLFLKVKFLTELVFPILFLKKICVPPHFQKQDSCLDSNDKRRHFFH